MVGDARMRVRIANKLHVTCHLANQSAPLGQLFPCINKKLGEALYLVTVILNMSFVKLVVLGVAFVLFSCAVNAKLKDGDCEGKLLRGAVALNYFLIFSMCGFSGEA